MTTILAGDIGGTKTLLATYQVDGDQLIEQRRERYSSAEWHDFAELLNHFLGPLADRPQRGCLAIAGPVQGGRVQLTNLPWMLEEHALQNACAIEHLELVNDFAVLIYGLNHLQAHQQHTLVAQPAISGAPIAILGAGTGLGVAMGIPGPRGLMAMASEAAHGEFAARTEAEWQLKQWLLQDQGLERVSIERVVSGPGLGQVFRWCLSQHTGSTGSTTSWAMRSPVETAREGRGQSGRGYRRGGRVCRGPPGRPVLLPLKSASEWLKRITPTFPR